ncbi:hypothetical protein [Enterobacter kobei]|uniref:hypothetical protein n=1 Tax=Enterobacter kobei TaxID=208224 RepID=UPI00237911D6|nr:hypothetical protein [Enterobacter kobei]MDD9218455.1 hypothetical protein [Enterobacter kobei]
MASINELIQNIKQEKISTSGRSVLLVEGPDDVLAFSNFLQKTNANWELSWILESAGNKRNVLEILRREPDWLGIVDRDEWDDARIQQITDEYQNAIVLPRFCIESYLVVPTELWRAIPENMRTAVAGGEQGFIQRLTQNQDKWLSHAALWAVINPLWEGLRALGFKEALLEPAIANDLEQIADKLQDWHNYLEPGQLIVQIAAKKEELSSLDFSELLRFFVHGKHFFNEVVHQEFCQSFGTVSASKRKTNIFSTLSVPDDLTDIWQRMNLIPEDN